MRKVVVVVSDKPTTAKIGDKMTITDYPSEEFEGNNLKVIDSSTMGTSKVLIVKDGDEELAVFQQWLYWKKIE